MSSWIVTTKGYEPKRPLECLVSDQGTTTPGVTLDTVGNKTDGGWRARVRRDILKTSIVTKEIDDDGTRNTRLPVTLCRIDRIMKCLSRGFNQTLAQGQYGN